MLLAKERCAIILVGLTVFVLWTIKKRDPMAGKAPGWIALGGIRNFEGGTYNFEIKLYDILIMIDCQINLVN